MNYRRWFIAGFVAAVAIFSFWHLSTAGTDYKVLTTSDSGYFYGMARSINQEDGFIDSYELSHPPQGKDITNSGQFQSLMLVTLYRGVHAVDHDVSLMGVQKYFSPFIFAISVIGAFLAARELGGDLAGCASAIFISTLVGSIYWTKIGAFDREITLVFFGTWLFYIVGKAFKSRGKDLLKYSILGGLFYGLFLITWEGAAFLGLIIGGTIGLIILERAVSGLGITLAGIGMYVVGRGFEGFDVAQLVGTFLLLGGFIKLAVGWEALKKIESKLFSALKSNWRIIGGLLGLVVISTGVVVVVGGQKPDFWFNILSGRVAGFVGLGGGGGVSFPKFATEMASAPAAPAKFFENGLNVRLYRNLLLTSLTTILVIIGMIEVFRSSKKPHYLFAFSWFLLVLPMPLSQARFFRIFWPMWPVLAGFGVGVLVMWIRKVSFSPMFSAFDWFERLRHPLVLGFVFLVLITPFFTNVRADSNASDTVPYPHGSSLPTVFYESLLDSFWWVRENTPENSVIVIPWSYGHFTTGATKRPSVTDGGQTMGWRDEWRDSSGVKPPDYIRYVQNGKGYIIGKNVGASKYQINGRRIDIQRMVLTEDENYFAWIANTYRENYNIGMDYIIFNNSLSSSGTTLQTVVMNMYSDVDTTQQVQTTGQGYVFQFEQENIIFGYGGTPITQDNKEIGGFVAYDLAQGRLLNYSFNQSPEESKLLWIFLGEGQKVEAGGLGNFNGVPMIVRALDQTHKMPNYLEEVYRSPAGQAAVYKIDHEKVSNYL